MSDYRNTDFDPLSPEDPYRRDAKLDPDLRAANTMWGWIAAAVFVVVILAVAFGVVRQPGQLGTDTASNDVTAPSAVTHMAPPAAVPPAKPGIQSGMQASPTPISPAPSPMPNTPAQPGGQ